MTSIEIYTTSYCPYCQRAKALLDRKGVTYQEIDVERDTARREEMMVRSGRRTVPQVFINGEAIGGCDDLHTLDANGKLDAILSRQRP
jgi:glutaredoxin 3